MGKKEILTDPQKLKFIEILIIVGAILSAFNLPIEMVWLFMLFVLFSLLYYVYLQREDKNIRIFNIYAEFVALFFSAVFTYLFSVSIMTVTIDYFPYTVVIPITYYFVLTWVFYEVLSKPVEGGKRSMWERFGRYYGLISRIGITLIVMGGGLIGCAIYIFATNNGEIAWSDILAIGLALISFGIALISLGISRDSTKRLERVTDSDYDNFVDLLENARISFLEEARFRGIDHFMVEVVAWKSKQYFERAINLREWVIDKSKLRFLPIMVKHLAHVLLVQGQAVGKEWIKEVWNRDVLNIVKMYNQLWDTGVIDYAEEHIKSALIDIFDNYIGERKPDEDDLSFYKRTQKAVGEKEANKPFERIMLEKKPKKK